MKIDPYVMGAVFLALLVFGVWYNKWVEQLECKGHDRGFMSLLVTAGVAVTGIGVHLIVRLPEVALVMLGCFTASGLPMIIGSVQRYCLRRAAEEFAAKEEAERRVDATKTRGVHR